MKSKLATIATIGVIGLGALALGSTCSREIEQDPPATPDTTAILRARQDSFIASLKPSPRFYPPEYNPIVLALNGELGNRILRFAAYDDGVPVAGAVSSATMTVQGDSAKEATFLLLRKREYCRDCTEVKVCTFAVSPSKNAKGEATHSDTTFSNETVYSKNGYAVYGVPLHDSQRTRQLMEASPRLAYSVAGCNDLLNLYRERLRWDAIASRY